MIPAELVPRQIKLPAKDGCRIVIFTGNSLRHDRFALRIQRDFGERVVGWFQVAPEAKQGPSLTRIWSQIYSKARRLAENPKKLLRTPRYETERISDKMRKFRSSQGAVEQRLFGDEVQSLRKNAHLQPMCVGDPNSPTIISRVESLNPYLILTLDGGIYSTRLLKTAKGLALNQHAGWCPAYRGSNTVVWGLYHRDIKHIGNTVHILIPGMDAGPIVRRSTACLIYEDTLESCFARVVALGTELMCEVVAEVIRADQLTVYDQPAEQGFTYLAAHLTEPILRAIDRDLSNGLLSTELSRLRHF
jgi:hypothetical protein